MKYLIYQLNSKSSSEKLINETDYHEILISRSCLLEISLFEEKYNFIIENYIEFEKELLNISTQMMVLQIIDPVEMRECKNNLSRRIANLLTTCTMYLDSCQHHMKTILCNQKEIDEKIDQLKNTQYDNILGYRVIEALRNHTQHRGFPIHNALFSYSLTADEPHLHRHSVIPVLDLSELEKNKKFKTAILHELKSLSKKFIFDMRIFIRDYIEAISNIHKILREMYEEKFIESENKLKNIVINNVSDSGFNYYLSGVSLLSIDENGEMINRQTLYSGFLENLYNYRKQNTSLINLRKRYSSNEIQDEDLD
jgi:hypothetical protein